MILLTNATIDGMEVLNWIGQHIWQIIIGAGVFFEITPIKINPISWIVGVVSKPIYAKIDDLKKELKDDINSVKTDFKTEITEIKQYQEQSDLTVKELIQSNEMSEISRIRWEILEFSNSIENCQLHTRDEYRHIKEDNIRYHELINKYGLTNGLITEEYEKIENHYNDNKDSSAVYI